MDLMCAGTGAKLLPLQRLRRSFSSNIACLVRDQPIAQYLSNPSPPVAFAPRSMMPHLLNKKKLKTPEDGERGVDSDDSDYEHVAIKDADEAYLLQTKKEE